MDVQARSPRPLSELTQNRYHLCVISVAGLLFVVSGIMNLHFGLSGFPAFRGQQFLLSSPLAFAGAIALAIAEHRSRWINTRFGPDSMIYIGLIMMAMGFGEMYK